MAEQLESLLSGEVGHDRLEVFDHIRELAGYFCTPRPADELIIGVFQVAGLENLLQLADVWDMISDLRIILVLPDRNRKTIAAGHKLHPRYVTFNDSNIKEIRAVVRKIIAAAERKTAFRKKRRITQFPWTTASRTFKFRKHAGKWRFLR